MSRENSPAAAPMDVDPKKDDAPTSATAEAAPAAPEPADADAAAPKGSAAEERQGVTAPADKTEGSDKAGEAAKDEKPSEQTKEQEKSDVEMTTDEPEATNGPVAADTADEVETTKPTGDDVPADDAAGAENNKPKVVARVNPPKGKKLNKKASKARILHLDAQPGDHFFVKLKGFPQWPVIVCDEDMLPSSLIKSRPVSAKRVDGTYREDFADGGKRVADRTFPVMYLFTNEFGWVPNSDLIELNPATIGEIKTDKMRKDLQAAHELAAENHPLSYYKDLLQQYQEELIQQEKAKAAKAATPKGKKSKAAEADEDVDMEDAPDYETPAKDKKAKKRKAEESAETPQRTESVKKPKIKLTSSSTPKVANGTAAATPKTAKPASGESKSTKAKNKKVKDEEEKQAEKEATPKEPELSAEEKHARKKKEVLFFRHKLQKGLLTRDQEPKEEEMQGMSDYITKLEGFPDLEVSIIRETKINKVLKAILKLENIPKEDEFKFKTRSQVLLDKWNKLLTANGGSGDAAAANGVNGSKDKEASTKTNGVKEKSEGEAGKEKEEAEEGGGESAAEETKGEAVETSA